jgi:hypothetical protein
MMETGRWVLRMLLSRYGFFGWAISVLAEEAEGEFFYSKTEWVGVWGYGVGGVGLDFASHGLAGIEWDVEGDFLAYDAVVPGLGTHRAVLGDAILEHFRPGSEAICPWG